MFRSLLAFTLLLWATAVQSQNVCDQLIIADIFIHPIDQNLLVIESENTGEELFGYPGFRIFHDGELIGEEQVVYFGLAGSSYHFVELLEPIEESVEYTFDLELWTTFYGELACEYSWTGTPYDPSGCFEGVFSLFLSGTGSEEVMIQVTDQDGNTLIEITETLDPVNPTFSESLCLPRGCFAIDITPTDGEMDVNVVLNFATDGYTWFNELVEEGGDGLTTEMPIWNGCFLSVEQIILEQINFFPNPVKAGERLQHSRFPKGSRIRLYTISGDLIADLSEIEKVAFPSAGLYFAAVEFPDGHIITRRIIVE